MYERVCRSLPGLYDDAQILKATPPPCSSIFNTPQFGGATNGETVGGEVGVNSNYSTNNFSNCLFIGGREDSTGSIRCLNV